MSIEQLPARATPRPAVERTVRKPTAGERLVSLDAYRGFVMLLMVSAGLGLAQLPKNADWQSLVGRYEFLQSPFWDWLWGQFDHRAWEGCSLWDLIQPSFMFIVGVAMPISFARRSEQGQSWGRQFVHVLWRAFLLILVGVYLDSFSSQHPDVSMIRVLQQIALGYVLAFLVLNRGPGIQVLAAAVVLALHTAAYVLYGLKNGTDPWLISDNFGIYLDRLIHSPFAALADGNANSGWNRILPVPKGDYADINALSSTATILFGVLCGELFLSRQTQSRKVLILVVAGAAGLAAGMALWPVLPVVKHIWTASFTLFAAGWTCLLMAAFYYVVDVRHYRRWTMPLVVVGMNSIAMYVMSGTVKRGVIERSITTFLGEPLGYLPLLGPIILSCLVLLGLWGCCYWLYRRRIFFKL